jgi:hypothetical protein
MTLDDFLKLAENYSKSLPMEMVLSDLMFKGKLDTNTILLSYTSALEKERHILNSRFNEAAINLTQILSGNFKKKEQKEEVYKRAIHTYNLNKSIVPHIHDTKYGYTEEDEKKWDKFCETKYGVKL